MKKRILVPLFLFSLVFNVVYVIDLLSDRHAESTASSGGFELTDTQKQKIAAESAVLESDNKRLESELERCRKDLYLLLNEESTDKARVEACITAINDIQKKMQLNTVEQLLIYKKHMTKEQCKCFLKEFGSKMNVDHTCDENCNCMK